MRATILIGLALLVGCSDGEGPALIVGPAGANTFDDIYVEVDDDKLDKYTYQWSVDGEELEDLTEPTVPSDLTRKGEDWTVTVTKGNVSSSATITIGNALPSAEVSISPANPTSLDTITASGSASDPDGDPAFVTYEWAVKNPEDTDFTESRFKSTTIPPTATQRGQIWRVTVTPDDGDDEGPQGYLEFTIRNGLPVITRLDLNRLTATTDTELSVTAEATDPDDDDVDLEYVWVINGVEVPDSNSPSFDGAAEGGFDAGDDVYVKVRATDGEPGPWRASPNITVRNGAPSAPEAAVEPAEPLEDEDLRCVVTTESTDSDPGDAITYRAEWLVNGAPYTGGSTTTFAGDTVSAEITEAGDTWTCRLFASDPLGNWSEATASVFVDSRSGCADGTTEVDWNIDTEGCAAADKITWTEANENTATYCAAGWEMADSSVVNAILNGPGYADDWLFAFHGDGCSEHDAYATTNDSRWRSDKGCVWRRSHHTRIDEDDEVDGVMCVRSPEEVEE